MDMDAGRYLAFRKTPNELVRELAETAVVDLAEAWELELDRYFADGEAIDVRTAPARTILGERPSSGYRAVKIPMRPETDEERSAVYEELGEALAREPVGDRPNETYTDHVIGETFGALARHVAPTGRIESGLEEAPRVELIAEDLFGPGEVERILGYDAVLAEFEAAFEELAAVDDPADRAGPARDIVERMRDEVPTAFEREPAHPPSLTAQYLEEFNVALRSVGTHLDREVRSNGAVHRPETYAFTMQDFRRRYASGMERTSREDIEETRRWEVQKHLAREGVFGGHFTGGKLARYIVETGEPAAVVHMPNDAIREQYGDFIAETNERYGITDELVDAYFAPGLLLNADDNRPPADDLPGSA